MKLENASHWLSLILTLGTACGPETEPLDARHPATPAVEAPGKRSADDVPVAALPLSTLIRVVNHSTVTRSRSQACFGDRFPYRPLREGVESPSVCALAPLCSALDESETLPRDVCSAPACQGARLDLAPGAAEELLWDGIYWEGSTRGCRQETTLEPGAPLTMKVCWGQPQGEYDVVFASPSCTTVHFAYGDEQVEVELH